MGLETLTDFSKAKVPDSPEAAYRFISDNIKGFLSLYDKEVLHGYDTSRDFALSIEEDYDSIKESIFEEAYSVAVSGAMPIMPVENLVKSESHLYAIRDLFKIVIKSNEDLELLKQDGAQALVNIFKNNSALIKELYMMMLNLIEYSSENTKR